MTDRPVTTDASVDREAANASGKMLEEAQLSLPPIKVLPEVDGIRVGDVIFIEPENKVDPAVAQAVKDNLPDDCVPEGTEVPYLYNKVDLNDDGVKDVLVYLGGPFFSGTGGCTTMMMEGARSGSGAVNYEKVLGYETVSQIPTIVSPNKDNGYHDLVQYVSGGGQQPAFKTLQFDAVSKCYPGNPTLLPDMPRGSILEGNAYLSLLEDGEKSHWLKVVKGPASRP
jgi:hypothetical protein